MALLTTVAAGGDVPLAASGTSERDAFRTLAALGAVTVSDAGLIVPAQRSIFTEDGHIDRAGLLACLEQVPGGSEGLRILGERPEASPMEVGEAIREAAGAKWTASSTHSIGGHFRAWAKELGIRVDKVPRPSKR